MRAKYHVCGTLTGTLPQIPQQNMFLGLPLELMTEEAALLVEKGSSFVLQPVRRDHQLQPCDAEEEKYWERYRRGLHNR